MANGNNRLAVKSARRVRLPFTDFSGGLNALVSDRLLPQKYAADAYNVTGRSGALRGFGGLSRLKLPGAAEALPELPAALLRVYLYRRFDPEAQRQDDRLVAYCADGKCYQLPLSGGTAFAALPGAVFTAPPAAVNYRLNGADVIILCGERDCMTVWDGGEAAYTVPDAPRISSMCLHYERLFATVDGEKSAVWFSDDLDPTNWDVSLDDAGFIEIIDDKGALLKVLRFADYVYIFRSFGISRLTAYAEQTEFSVMPLTVSSGRIYPDTVAVCGDVILFLAEDGLFAFNGLSCKRILDGVFPLLKEQDNSAACAAYHNGSYYLACRMRSEQDESPGAVNNALLCFDIQSGSFAVMKGADIAALCAINAESFTALAVTVRGEHASSAGMTDDSGRLFGMPLKKVWLTPETDFGYPDRLKTVRELYLYSAAPSAVDVITDSGKKTVFFPGKPGIQRARVMLRGRTLRLRFHADTAEMDVAKPLITADIV